MANDYEYTMSGWAENGEKAAPSDTLKSTGFAGGMKPPASVFNWFWDWVIKAITELQNKAITQLPATMTPTAHTHDQGDITGLTNALAGKSDTNHTHTLESIGAAPSYTYGTTDMEDGVSTLETGKLYFFYEEL